MNYTMLYETLSQIINLPAELGIVGNILIASALTIMVMFIVTYLLEFFVGFLKGL